MILSEYVILPEPKKARSKRADSKQEMPGVEDEDTTGPVYYIKRIRDKMKAWFFQGKPGGSWVIQLYMVIRYTWSNQNETYMGGSLTLLGNRTSIVSHELHNQNTTMNMNDMCMIIFIDAVLHCGKLHVTTPLQHHNNYPTEASFWWALSEVRGTSCLRVAPRNECLVGPSRFDMREKLKG